jgi:hypothetical protein
MSKIAAGVEKSPAQVAMEAFYTKFYDETIEDVRNRLIHALHKNGIWKVEGSYSGGHDEGGLDSYDFKCWDKAGTELEVPTGYDDEVFKACNDVLTTKFFSWALDGWVAGKLYVDMKKRKVWTEGQHEEMVDDDDPIDWEL